MLICGTPKGILMLKRLEKILNGFYTTQVWTKVGVPVAFGPKTTLSLKGSL